MKCKARIIQTQQNLFFIKNPLHCHPHDYDEIRKIKSEPSEAKYEILL